LSIQNILSDYAEIEAFAAEVERSPRTVIRWMDEPNGLPFTKLGSRRLIHLPTAREWLLGRIRRPNPRRRAVRAPVRVPQKKKGPSVRPPGRASS
jgi:hypothetical protein